MFWKIKIIDYKSYFKFIQSTVIFSDNNCMFSMETACELCLINLTEVFIHKYMVILVLIKVIMKENGTIYEK